VSLLDFLKPKPDVLPQREHSTRIFRLSTEAADATRKQMDASGEKLENTPWFALIMEYQNLYLQLTDRALFAAYPDPKRAKIMDELVELCLDTSVAAICKDWGYERIKKIQIETMENYKKSILDYGVCKKIVPDQGESPAGTFLWEFSKTAAGIIAHEADIAYMGFFVQLVNFKGLNARAFVDAVK
jgi:hypothetical protein